MKDIFDYKNNEKEKKERNLKSWSVKLPENVINELEEMFESSGLKYKNEFMEQMLQKHKMKMIKEGKYKEEMIHPEIESVLSNDIRELSRLTQNINSLFVKRIEKMSNMMYELERMEKQLKNKHSEKILTLEEELSYIREQIDSKIEGLKKENRDTIFNEELFKKSNINISKRLYVGYTGTGKTFTIKKEIQHSIQKGQPVIVFDNCNEYEHIVKNYGGQLIKLNGINGINRINPLEIHISEEELENHKSPLVEKILNLCSIFETIISRKLNAQERKTLLDVIETTYREYGITEKFGITKEPTNESKQMPTLLELEKNLRKSNTTGRDLADELEPFSSGILNLFSGNRNFQITKCPIIVFDISELEENLKQIAPAIILDFIYQIIKKNIFQKPLIVVTELFQIFHSNGSESIFNKLLEMKNIDMISSLQIFENKTLINKFDTLILFKTSKNEASKIFFEVNDVDEYLFDNMTNFQALVHIKSKETFHKKESFIIDLQN